MGFKSETHSEEDKMLKKDKVDSSIKGSKVFDYRESRDEIDIGFVDVERVKEIDKTCVDPGKAFHKFKGIADHYSDNKEDIVEVLAEETGYTVNDSEMLLDAAIEFLEGIDTQYQRVFEENFELGAENSTTGNRIRTRMRPKGNILVITPGNATLPLAVILSASALVTGNTVTLKPSARVARTAYNVMRPFVEEFGERFNLVFADSGEITEPDVLQNFDVVHYTGSSRYYESIKTAADKAKIDSYIEGEGNGVFIVDDRPQDAAEALVSALTRCNGKLCTTPSGVMVREDISQEFKMFLKDEMKDLNIGSVFSKATDLSEGVETDFDAEPLEGFEGFKPKILRPGDEISQMELYGPGAWLDTWESREELESFLESRRHGLNITVFTDENDFFQHSMARASRYCINTDPTLQSPFEPWGALGASGDSPGTTFMEKFCRKTVELRGDQK